MAQLEIHFKRRDRSCLYLVITGRTHAWALLSNLQGFTIIYWKILYCYTFNFNQGQNFSDLSLYHIFEWKKFSLPFSLNCG